MLGSVSLGQGQVASGMNSCIIQAAGLFTCYDSSSYRLHVDYSVVIEAAIRKYAPT